MFTVKISFSRTFILFLQTQLWTHFHNKKGSIAKQLATHYLKSRQKNPILQKIIGSAFLAGNNLILVKKTSPQFRRKDSKYAIFNHKKKNLSVEFENTDTIWILDDLVSGIRGFKTMAIKV